MDMISERLVLKAEAERIADLCSSISDGELLTIGSEWTLSEVAAHLVATLRTFTQAVNGSFVAITPYISNAGNFSERLAAVTAGSLRLVHERDLCALAVMLKDATHDFLDTTDGLPRDTAIRAPWYGERVSLSLEVTTSLLIVEQLLHGYDIARTVGQSWAISQAEAVLSVPVIKAMLPLIVNSESASGETVIYDVRVDGQPSFIVQFRNGAAMVRGVDIDVVDCLLPLDAVDLMLGVYGRLDFRKSLASGSVRASGRKPWMGLRFQDFIVSP